MTDFVVLWLEGERDNLLKRGKDLDESYQLLKNKDSNYAKAHRVTANAFVASASVFSDALAAHTSGIVRFFRPRASSSD